MNVICNLAVWGITTQSDINATSKTIELWVKTHVLGIEKIDLESILPEIELILTKAQTEELIATLTEGLNKYNKYWKE